MYSWMPMNSHWETEPFPVVSTWRIMSWTVSKLASKPWACIHACTSSGPRKLLPAGLASSKANFSICSSPRVMTTFWKWFHTGLGPRAMVTLLSALGTTSMKGPREGRKESAAGLLPARSDKSCHVWWAMLRPAPSSSWASAVPQARQAARSACISAFSASRVCTEVITWLCLRWAASAWSWATRRCCSLRCISASISLRRWSVRRRASCHSWYSASARAFRSAASTSFATSRHLPTWSSICSFCSSTYCISICLCCWAAVSCNS
mmetsp:Transcript_118801/g.206897  ORF Transcript_118801/g.206897 Transcript_118801/m.206897 type:complete len:265 (+) Transcript_118801:93-887(+)